MKKIIEYFMLKRVQRLPLKWKVLLSVQAAVTGLLIARRVNGSEEFDRALFERRVIKVERDTSGKLKVDDRVK